MAAKKKSSKKTESKKSKSKDSSPLKEHDFIEIEYTGKLEDGSVFDTTDQKRAEEAGIAREGAQFGPVTVCLGEQHILEGLEDEVIGKKPGKTLTITLEPEKAFGKKSAKLLQLVPRKYFRKEEIQPVPGLEVTIDDRYGIIRSVSGGRVIVDFNHPLASKTVTYELKINKKIDKPIEQAKAIFRNELNANVKLEMDGKTLVIDEEIPEQLLEAVKKRIVDLTDIKDVTTKNTSKKKGKSEKEKKKKKKEDKK